MDNKVKKYEDQIKDLKKEIDRLSEENSNFKIISKSHKEINGELQTKLSKAELKIKELEVKLKEQVAEGVYSTNKLLKLFKKPQARVPILYALSLLIENKNNRKEIAKKLYNDVLKRVRYKEDIKNMPKKGAFEEVKGKLRSFYDDWMK